jgi:hypothetical protein
MTMFASFTAVCLAVLAQPVSTPVQEEEGGTPRLWTVTLAAEIDGSGVFTFTEESVSYAHKHWEPPTRVMFNEKPWDDLTKSPEAWTEQRGKLDLTHAWVAGRQGRDVIAMEKTATGFKVYVSDSPNGADAYSIIIAIPVRPDEEIPTSPQIGLMGRACVSGNDSGLVLRYQPGRFFRQETFDDLLAQQGIPSRDVRIELAGVLQLGTATAVQVRHKGGSSNGGVLRLSLNGQELGAVGDDRTKDTTYQIELPAGAHTIGWVLTGGAIGDENMIQFTDARTNRPLATYVPAEAAAQVRSVPFKAEVDVSRN